MTLLVETCSLHITLCNKNSCADVQISITVLMNTPDPRSCSVGNAAQIGVPRAVTQNNTKEQTEILTRT